MPQNRCGSGLASGASRARPRRCLRTGADQGLLPVPAPRACAGASEQAWIRAGSGGLPPAPAAVPQNRCGSGFASGASGARPRRRLRTGADQGSRRVPPVRARAGTSEQARIRVRFGCAPCAPAPVPQNRRGSGLASGASRARPRRCLRTGADRGSLRVPPCAPAPVPQNGGGSGPAPGASRPAPAPVPQSRSRSGLASGACRTARAGDSQPLDPPRRGAGSGAPRRGGARPAELDCGERLWALSLTSFALVCQAN